MLNYFYVLQRSATKKLSIALFSKYILWYLIRDFGGIEQMLGRRQPGFTLFSRDNPPLFTLLQLKT